MAWDIAFRHNLADNPLLRARLRMTLYFVAFSSCVFFFVSYFADQLAHEVIREASIHPSTITSADALHRVDIIRWVSRVMYIIILSGGTFVLMGIALRPVRDSIASERRFIANISHELRTPLTLAKAETEMLLKKPEQLDLPRAVAGLKQNLEEISNLSRIIQFLLLLSDFSDQKTAPVRQEVHLADSIKNIETQTAHLLERKKVEVLTILKAPHVVVQGNPVALEKMLLNLVRNAITYSNADDTVTVELTTTDRDTPLITVRDQGSGMSTEDLNHIFEPFYRGKNAKPGGTGLGLSIVREVVKLHKAKIAVKSVLGEGTEFTIEFPSSR